ncbi:hypothetical protein [Pseudoalteromonas gelatinilytica]|uniref:Porin n=1 Tax=Pseudoalteromonas gelatinilytica TaxID=1703256 RepID=A0ABQ1TII2_9GAMM|nr:hypothetical protein [Pseudoalteromonas profundi]GGE96309.1 hypothetical protein GCM10008027_21680 [Pseudoalteromonas profundi]
MNKFCKSLLVSCLLILSQHVLAEDLLEGVEIRKTFKGSAIDSASPASFNISGGSGSDTYHNIDLAIKIKEHEFDFDRQGVWRGRMYPTVEFHKNSDENNESENAQAALSFEFERGLGSCAQDKSPFCTSMFWDAAFKVKRDSHNDKTTQNVSLFATYSKAGKGGSYGPNSIIVFGDEALKLIYLPLLGFEYHRNLPIEEKVDGEKVEVAGAVDEYFAVARLNLGITPFAKALDEKLKLVVDYSFRSTLGSNDLIDDSNAFIDVSLDFYLDEKDRLAFGFNYSHGKSPSRNFLDEEKWGIGFKFKL